MSHPRDDEPLPPGFAVLPDGRAVWRLALARPETVVPPGPFCYRLMTIVPGETVPDDEALAEFGRAVREALSYNKPTRIKRVLCPFWHRTRWGTTRCEFNGVEELDDQNYPESLALLEAHYGRPRAEIKVYGANFVSDESKVCGILDGQSREQDYDDEAEIDEVPCGWHELPAEVRAAIGPALPEGHHVYRVPAADSRGRPGIEWWWVDDAGELVEAFWFDPR